MLKFNLLLKFVFELKFKELRNLYFYLWLLYCWNYRNNWSVFDIAGWSLFFWDYRGNVFSVFFGEFFLVRGVRGNVEKCLYVNITNFNLLVKRE